MNDLAWKVGDEVTYRTRRFTIDKLLPSRGQALLINDEGGWLFASLEELR